MTNRLDKDGLERLRPLIELELHRRLQSDTGVPRIATVLREIFVHLCGTGRKDDERLCFLSFAAPIGREVALACAVLGKLPRHDARRLVAFGQWFDRVQSFDPVCTRMIDLFYFGGLGTRRTAALVGLSRHTVVRELRFAKAWWMQAQMRQAS